MDRREKPPRDTAKDRRWTVTVVGTLLWIIVGNAALHLNVAAVYGVAAVIAVLLWAVTAPRA